MSCALQAVVFDMDGLLVDTEPIWYDVQSVVIERLGNTWSPEQHALLLGGSMQNTVAYLLSRADRPVPPAVVEGWLVEEMLLQVRQKVPMRPGALDLLDAVREAGVPAALVSSSYRVLIDAVLETVGPDRFAASVAGDEVAHPKPHPEGYLRAAALLGIDPRYGVVLEDSDSGASAGVAAGFVTVYVPSEGAVPGGAGRVMRESLVGISVDWLNGLLPPAGAGAPGGGSVAGDGGQYVEPGGAPRRQPGRQHPGKCGQQHEHRHPEDGEGELGDALVDQGPLDGDTEGRPDEQAEQAAENGNDHCLDPDHALDLPP